MLNCIIAIIFICILLILIDFYLKLKKYEHLPGPKAWPLIGNMLLYIKKAAPVSDVIIDVLMELRKKYEKEGLFYFFSGTVPLVVLTSKENIRALLLSNNIDKPVNYKVLKVLSGAGLATQDAKTWRERRKLVNPSFHLSILTEYITIFNSVAKETVSYLKMQPNSKYFDAYTLFTGLTLRLICETTMGYKLNPNLTADAEYLKSCRVLKFHLVGRIFNPFYHNEFIYKNFIGGKEYRHATKIQREFISNVVNKRKQILQEENFLKPNSNKRIQRLSMLDSLLKQQMDGVTLTDQDICDECQMVMFAGHDTLSSFFLFAMITLGNDQEIQEKLRKEIQENIDFSEDQIVKREHFSKLPYLNGFMKEILRLYTVPTVGRLLCEDLVLEKYVIPKGTITFLMLYGLHHDEKNYPNPELCIPERYMNQNEKNGPDDWAFLPFSGGQRICIGVKFAHWQMKTLLSYLINYFKIETIEKLSEIQIVCGLILFTKKPINVKFIPIN